MTQTPQTKFSDEATGGEILSLMMILYSISLKRDIVELNRFIIIVAKIIGPDDFNRMLRIVVKMMGEEKCGNVSCSDWLMTKLYELYVSHGFNKSPDL